LTGVVHDGCGIVGVVSHHRYQITAFKQCAIRDENVGREGVDVGVYGFGEFSPSRLMFLACVFVLFLRLEGY
jgi:hypothetical protein